MNPAVFLRDPMVRVLALSLLGAIMLPAAGVWREAAQMLSNVAIFVLFFVNGLRIARRDIRAGLANWRFIVPLAAFVFPVMAGAGYLLSIVTAPFLPPLLALGFVYLGALPSTVQSATSYTTLAGGNVALSVIGAALINLLGVLVTVPIFAVLGGAGTASVGSETAIRIATLLILPFFLGQMTQDWFRSYIVHHAKNAVWLDRFVIGIAVYVAISGAVIQGIGSAVPASAWAIMLAMVAIFLVFANGGAWGVARALRYPAADRSAFLFAATQKSAAVGAPLAALLFPPAQAGFILVPLLLYYVLQMMIAAPLSTMLRRRQWGQPFG